MDSFATLSLPDPIQAYFEANAHLDVEAMLAPFAADAIVRDERRTHRGADAIRAWIEQATVGAQAIAVPLAIRSDGDSHHVETRVAGTFPGSPLLLSFHVRLDDGRIAELEIG